LALQPHCWSFQPRARIHRHHPLRRERASRFASPLTPSSATAPIVSRRCAAELFFSRQETACHAMLAILSAAPAAISTGGSDRTRCPGSGAMSDFRNTDLVAARSISSRIG
jgi:hypothetical protein